MRIPAMQISFSGGMAVAISSDADRHRSEATLDFTYHAEVIGIRQASSCRSGAAGRAGGV